MIKYNFYKTYHENLFVIKLSKEIIMLYENEIRMGKYRGGINQTKEKISEYELLFNNELKEQILKGIQKIKYYIKSINKYNYVLRKFYSISVDRLNEENYIRINKVIEDIESKYNVEQKQYVKEFDINNIDDVLSMGYELYRIYDFLSDNQKENKQIVQAMIKSNIYSTSKIKEIIEKDKTNILTFIEKAKNYSEITLNKDIVDEEILNAIIKNKNNIYIKKGK